MLSKARFGPGSIVIFSLLAAGGILFLVLGEKYLSLMFFGTFALIFGIKSFEVLQLVEPEERNFTGRKCYVVQGLAKGKRGIVKVYAENGSLGSELWSAESYQNITEGSVAKISGVRSIILLIDPLAKDEKTLKKA